MWCGLVGVVLCVCVYAYWCVFAHAMRGDMHIKWYSGCATIIKEQVVVFSLNIVSSHRLFHELEALLDAACAMRVGIHAYVL